MVFARELANGFCQQKEEKNFILLTKTMGYPFTKITKMATFNNRYLYSHSFDLEHNQTPFQGLFSQKRKNFVFFSNIINQPHYEDPKTSDS